jgi:O-antigen/teichoic acid export membrane protein
VLLTRVTNLFRNTMIYGMGSVATNVVSLLLLPIFTRYLTPSDYGIITMLLTIEAAAQVLFRWGVDTAFMRLYYDCADQRARQQLASTIFLFLLTASGLLSNLLFHSHAYTLLIQLVIANTFAGGFFFMPFQVMRIKEQPAQFVSLAFTQSAGTIAARLVFVVGLHLEVFGIVAADLVITALMILIMIRWFVPLLRPVFSTTILREALGFGLPRVPHTVARQVIGFADRYFLNAFTTLREVGLYSIGATFGLALKLFLSAFESAWTPFFLGIMNQRDAKRIYSTISTYVVSVLVLLVAGVCVTAPAIVRIFTNAKFRGAEVVTPWIAMGVMFQGLYLLGSIGLVITKRTKVYPISTGAAAAASVIGNLLLIPRLGIVGAALANAIAYFTLACVTVGASWYYYPIQYEWNRLARITVAGVAGYLASAHGVPTSLRPIHQVLACMVLTTAVYGLVLLVSGFFRPGELKLLRDIRARTLQWNKSPVMRSEMPVEMAGEFIDTPTEPGSDALDS